MLLKIWGEIYSYTGYNITYKGEPRIMKQIGKRLKYLRESIGLNQEDMAAQIGTSQSSVNRYENWQTSIPPALLRCYVDFLMYL